MQFYIDETTDEHFAFEDGTPSEFIPQHLTPCPEKPSLYHNWDATSKAWVEDTATKNADALALIRAERDDLLAQTDKYLVVDFPITAAKLKAIKTWRQSLRDALSTADPAVELTTLKANAPITL